MFCDRGCKSESRNIDFVKNNFLVHINVREIFSLIGMSMLKPFSCTIYGLWWPFANSSTLLIELGIPRVWLSFATHWKYISALNVKKIPCFSLSESIFMWTRYLLQTIWDVGRLICAPSSLSFERSNSLRSLWAHFAITYRTRPTLRYYNIIDVDGNIGVMSSFSNIVIAC